MSLTIQDKYELMRIMRDRSCAWTILDQSGLSKGELSNAIDAIDDYWEANKLSIKQAMDAAVGKTLTVATAKAVWKAWLTWIAKGE